MIRKIIIIALFSNFIFAQSAGNSGLSFLKIGPSAKTIAVSDIGFLDGDVSSVYYNPATVGFQNSESVLFTHHAWIQDLSSEILNANFTLWGLPLSIGANTTKIKGFEVRTKPSETPLSTFDVNYFSTNLSTGFGIYENLYLGFTIKYLYESFYSDDATGFGYDFGLAYNNFMQNFNIGASIRNLGSMNKLRYEKTELPTDLIVNATYNLHLEDASLDIIPVFGYQNYFDAKISHIHIGSDIVYNKQFSLRLGYVNGVESRNISFGAGINWEGFNVDYAFTPFRYGIGNANTFSLQYKF